MAQFDASINLDVNVNRALAGVNKVEKAVNRLNQGATVDVRVGNLNAAERAAARLYKQLERLENAALSKLPASLQTVIAYLKAASAGMGELASRAITVAAAMGDLGRINFSSLVRQLNQVSDLMFEIERVSVKFLDQPRNFRPRLEGGNLFQKLLDGLDLVKVRVIETERLLKGLGDTIKRIGGLGFGGPGGLGPGGPRGLLPPGVPGGPLGPGGGGPGGPLARRGGSAEPFDLNTLRGLRQLQAALRDLLETTQIGSKRFRDLENSIAQLNNEIRDAQLLGQRGGSGVGQEGGRRGSNRFGRAAVGAAFPALFGGGPASILGGFFGEIFSDLGGVVGSAIGSALDDLTQKAASFARAARGVGDVVTALEDALGSVDNSTKTYITNLQRSGQLVKAASKAQEELADKIGRENADAYLRAGQSIDSATGALGRFLTILTAVSQRLREGRRNPTGETPNGIFDLLPPQLRPERRGVSDTDAVERRTQESAEALNIAKLEREVAEATLSTDYERVDAAQRKLAAEQASVETLAIQRDLTEGKLSKEEAFNEVLAIEERYQTRLLELDKDRSDETERRAKEQDRAAKAAARESERAAKAAAREAERREREVQRTQRTLAGLDVRLQELTIERNQLGQTPRQQLLQQANTLDRIKELKAREIQLSGEDAAIQRQRLNILDKEIANERIKTSLQLEQLNIARAQEALQRSQSLQNQRSDLTLELAQASLFSGNRFEDERVQQRLQQQQRVSREIIARRQEIERLEEAAKSANDAISKPARERQQFLKDEIRLYEELLPRIFAAEQAQLAFNQALSLVQGPVNSLVSGFREVIAGTKSVEEAFVDFLNTIADQLANTAATMIANYIALGIARAFATGSSPNVPSFSQGVNNPLGVANSSGFNLNAFAGFFAKGGTIPSGQFGVVGENGPEFVSGPAKVTPMGAGTVVNITVNSNGTTNQSSSGRNAEEAAQLGRLIERSTLAIINREKRPGGTLAR